MSDRYIKIGFDENNVLEIDKHGDLNEIDLRIFRQTLTEIIEQNRRAK